MHGHPSGPLAATPATDAAAAGTTSGAGTLGLAGSGQGVFVICTLLPTLIWVHNKWHACPSSYNQLGSRTLSWPSGSGKARGRLKKKGKWKFKRKVKGKRSGKEKGERREGKGRGKGKRVGVGKRKWKGKADYPVKPLCDAS